jgi:hypothetical protein
VYVGDDESFSHKMTMKENRNKKQILDKKKKYSSGWFYNKKIKNKRKKKINDF